MRLVTVVGATVIVAIAILIGKRKRRPKGETDTYPMW